MAFNYDSSKRSPNYTPRAQAPSVWGRARTIEAIAIHWWGDPNTGPTLEGVVATFMNPARQASAHFVATGTGRRVSNMVPVEDASWCTNNANPFTISIECDPRCRPEDYDVVGELIAQIRNKYGNIPLVPHKQFVATACPGNYDLNRLNQVANSKQVNSGNWGDVRDKNMPTLIDEEGVRILAVTSLERPEPLTTTPDLKGHIGGDALAKIKEFWYSPEGKAANQLRKKWRADSEKLPTVEAELVAKEAQVKELEKKLQEAINDPSTGNFTENDRTMLQDVSNAVQWLVERFKSIFNSGENK